MKKIFTILFIVLAKVALVYGTTKCTKVNVVADSSYNISPQHAPVFNSEKQTLTDFLNSNVKINSSVTSKVFVEFIVERNGNLSNFNLLFNTDKYAGNEIIRVLKSSSAWTAGSYEYKGKRTILRTLYYLPIIISAGKVALIDPSKQTFQDSIDNHEIFSSADINPAFVGGEQAFGIFLRNHIRYPSLAKEKNVTGSVFISFVVESDGSLTHLNVLRDPGAGLGDETMRVMLQSPNWVPGIRKSQPIRVLYTVPVRYSLGR